MVIGFDGSRAFQEGRTGTENYSYQLLRALAKVDKKNTYIVYLRSDSVIPAYAGIQIKKLSSDLDSRRSLPRTLIRGGNDYYSWPKNFQFKIINWPRLWTQGGLALQTFKDNLDVLFVPAHTLPVIRKPGLKTVLTVHDLGSEYLPRMHQLKQKLYLSYMQKSQLKGAGAIIAVSKATKEDLINKVGVNPNKISVIYEAYDQKLFKPIKADLLVNTLIHYNLQPKTYFLFVGTVQPRKNLERLIRAFCVIARSETTKQSSSDNSHTKIASLPTVARNDTIKLVIAGSKGWLSDEIYRLPKELGMEDKVKFLGYVPEKDLPALYSGAVALSFPSLFEGFGLPILEAQACGCPVLTSDISSMPEVAGPPVGGGAIYVDPYDVDDIVKGMERVQGIAYRVLLIKAGFENVSRFSWEKCAKETLEVLETI